MTWFWGGIGWLCFLGCDARPQQLLFKGQAWLSQLLVQVAS